MNLALLERSAKATLRALDGIHPICAVILGSGWSQAFADSKKSVTVHYSSIPCLKHGGVAGHPGQISIVSHEGSRVLLFEGRRHYYEGAGWESVAFPVYLARRLGINAMILTNAAGGIRKDLQAGDIMPISDHINMTGSSPLIGTHNPFWGERFPDQTSVYNRQFLKIASQCARKAGIKSKPGIYAWLTGPTYETPAEVKALATLGADAVGMSTVPEAMLANSAGMKVLALSCIANKAAGVSALSLTHKEVLGTIADAAPTMKIVLLEIISCIAKSK